MVKIQQVEEMESFNQSKVFQSYGLGLEELNNAPQRNHNIMQQAKSKNTEALYKLYIQELKIRTRNSIIEKRTHDPQKQN